MKQVSISERLGMAEARNARLESRIVRQEAIITTLVERVAGIEAAFKSALKPARVTVEAATAQQSEALNTALLSAAKMSEISARVALAHGITPQEIRGPFRAVRFSHPRQEAMMIMYDAGYSLPRIGRFYKRDHTTILHGVRAARARIGETPAG